MPTHGRCWVLPPIELLLHPIFMAKPVLLTVDDDRDVLRSVERDLLRKYGARYAQAPRRTQGSRRAVSGGPSHAAHDRRGVSGPGARQPAERQARAADRL